MRTLLCQNARDLASLLIREGRALAIGGKAEILVNGAFPGHVIIQRQTQDLLIFSGDLGLGKFKRREVLLYGDFLPDFPGPKDYNPETVLTRNPSNESNSYVSQVPTVSDLYEGGCRFSVDSCPRAKFRPATPQADRLELQAGKALREWVKTLPPEQREEFKIRKRIAQAA